jgi:DNA-binding NtrC family response regulator
MLTILIADDNINIAETLKLALNLQGYMVLKLSPEDIIHFRIKPDLTVDVLITDYDLRYITGFDLLEKLRKFNPRLKSILISGCQECLLDGEGVFDEILLKPMDLNDLERILRNWNEERQN